MVSVRVDGPRPTILKACFSPDGKYLATAAGGIVQLWRAVDGSPVAMFTEHGADVAHVAFFSDSECLFSGDLDGVVCIHYLSDFTGQ